MIILSSPQFREGDLIPTCYTGEGQNLSPPLRWSGLPKNTKQLALICEDPDAPGPESWVHWVIYGINPETTSQIPEGISQKAQLRQPIEAKQGINSWGSLGYGGPLPPRGHGAHRYFFKLILLNQALELPSGLTKAQLLKSIEPHRLAEIQFMGRFERK
ncbi:MAG: YbhB/YbcL family Raf kinase inhibitor-like protein [Bdellovibrionia bacterium]